MRVPASRLVDALAGHGAVFVALDVRHPDGVRYPQPHANELSYADELTDEFAKDGKFNGRFASRAEP